MSQNASTQLQAIAAGLTEAIATKPDIPVRDMRAMTAMAAKLNDIARELKQEDDRHEQLQEQLRRQAAALQAHDQEKDQFIAILAHELRNPLTPIIHEIETAKLQGITDPEFSRTLEAIERQTNQISYLLKDLLDVSRAMRGKIQLQLVVADLVAVIKNAIGTAMPLIQKGHHTLDISLPDKPLMANVDPVRLEQVITNLLNNAAKYTDPHGRIRISMEQKGGQAVIRVKDNGTGIDPTLLPRIFDLFQQADQSLARVKGGLGVGLSLSRMLVQLHKGSITVTSDGLGKGTEFTVSLPIDINGKAAASGNSGTENHITRRHRILIVEDNPTLAEAFARLLRQMDQDVRTTYSGKEALVVAPEFMPEIIFVDIGMPGMDGYEVARHMRELPSLRHARLVALTGYGEESFREQSREAGFDCHLVKPIGIKEITNAVNDCI